MKLRPLQDRVIVKQSEAEEKTASGIVLPDSAKEKPTKGKVIAAGPGKLDENGKPIFYNASQTYRYMACRNNPGYQQFIQKLLRIGTEDLKVCSSHSAASCRCCTPSSSRATQRIRRSGLGLCRPRRPSGAFSF